MSHSDVLSFPTRRSSDLVYDFYGRNADRSFQRMKVQAGSADDFVCENEEKITKRLPKLFPLNSGKLLTFFIRYVEAKGDTSISNEEEKLKIGRASCRERM